MAIFKRYQYYSPEGKVVWTDWYKYSEHNNLLKDFQTKEKYQLNYPKLLNEFKVV